MKKNFPGYYPLKSESISELFTSATLVFDTDALLDLLRIQKDDANAFLFILKNQSIKDRLWLPYDVAWLYHLQMNNIVLKQIDGIKNVLSHLTTCKYLIELTRSYPYFSSNTMLVLNKCIRKIESESGLQQQFLVESLSDSPIKNGIDSIYTGRLGTTYTKGELKIIYEEASMRYTQFTPPGYLTDPNENERIHYHDYIVWKQMVKYATDKSKDIIFITGKVTDDWYYVINGDIVSPRQELIDEFMNLTQGKKFYSLSMFQFLEYCGQQLNLHIPRYENLHNQFKQSIEYTSIRQENLPINSGNI